MRVLFEVLGAHIRYRRQILKLAKSDLINTYKGAALGWLWSIIRPAITIATYYFGIAVGLRAGKPVGEYSYFLWLIAGMVPWFYISSTFTGGAGCIRKYSYLVTKIRYPISTIPTIVSLSNLVSHAIVVFVVMVIFICSGHYPDVYWLQLPFYTLLMVLFFSAWALFAGMISVISKDFMNLVKSSVMALFWLSGIIYSVKKVKNLWLRRFLSFNPVTIIVNGYRHALIDKVWFWEDWRLLRNFAMVYVLMLLLAVWVYKRLVREIPDVL